MLTNPTRQTEKVTSKQIENPHSWEMVHCHLLNTSRAAQFLVFECFTSQSMTVSMLVEFLQEIMKQQTSLSVMDLSSLHSRKWSSLHNTYIKLRTWSRQQLMNIGQRTIRCIPESKNVKIIIARQFYATWHLWQCTICYGGLCIKHKKFKNKA